VAVLCLLGCAPTGRPSGRPAGGGSPKGDAGKAGETIEVIELLEESALTPTVETNRLPADE
jgi:hypothetical protein